MFMAQTEISMTHGGKIIDALENIPSADVVPVVHGKWLFKFEGTYRRRKGYCSVCGQHSGIGGIQKNQEKSYCPNRGAKMNGSVGHEVD